MGHMRKARKKGLLLPAHLFSPDTAQSTLEYAVIIVCLVAALLAMSVYLKRSVQGNLRKSADQLGEQYEPRETTGSFTTTYSNKNVNTVNTVATSSIATANIITLRSVLSILILSKY